MRLQITCNPSLPPVALLSSLLASKYCMKFKTEWMCCSASRSSWPKTPEVYQKWALGPSVPVATVIPPYQH